MATDGYGKRELQRIEDMIKRSTTNRDKPMDNNLKETLERKNEEKKREQMDRKK